MSIFSNKLLSIRKSKELTMVKLSKESGLSQSYISQLENNKKYPTLEAINSLAKGLSIENGVLDIREQEKIKNELLESKNQDDLNQAIGSVDSLISRNGSFPQDKKHDELKQLFIDEINKKFDSKFIELSPLIEEVEPEKIYTLYGEPLSDNEKWLLTSTLLGIKEARNKN